jgi:hypothetical protein
MTSKVFLFILGCLVSLALTGCTPTYPREKFEESITRICKSEYKLDVKVAVVGKTIAIYLPLENLIDFTFSITKSASEKINDVILSVSRVALSTDAKFDFYCIIAHDVRMPEIQIVIIKSVDDVKRFLLNDISRGEYSKRMIVDIRLSPQAQKERAIKEVFDRTKLDKRWQEDVLNDFFRSEPTAVGDIGYWNGRFFVKDISLSEFLAEQIASRIKMEFREAKDLSDVIMIKSSKCVYTSREGKKYFKIDLMVENKYYGKPEEGAVSGKMLGLVLGVASAVIHNYRFNDVDHVEISYEKDKGYLKVSTDELEDFRKKKIKVDYFIKEK